MAESSLVILFLVITGILAVGLLITNMFFSFKYIPYDLGNNTIIAKIENDLNSKLIYDIALRTSCLRNEEELALETWDGTPDRCICDGQETPCSQKKGQCTTEAGVPARNFTYIKGYKICIVRKGETVLELMKSNKILNGDCPYNSRSCGVIDTLGRKLCLGNERECPINSLNQVLQNGVSSQLNKSNHLFHLLYEGNGYNMYPLNEENEEGKIISTFKISDGFPCIDTAQKKWKVYLPKRQITTYTCTTSVKGTIVDKRYIIFPKFRTNYSELYQDNNLNNYISDEMRRDDSIIDLYGRLYYGIDISGESFDYQKIMSIQDTSNTCNDVMRITSIVMICAVASPILALCGAPAAGGGNCDSRGVECFAIVYGVIIGIALVIGYLINFVVCIIIYISIQRLKWILVDNSNIGDEFTNEMFKLLLDNYSSNYNYALGIIIVIAIMFASGIISLILHCLTKM